nr:MAG TPA: hypothetical protein [Caudoviricetes sp.]DAT81609.1 MAG TPA: hypothetical protein [Caudoviricetes sp.]
MVIFVRLLHTRQPPTVSSQGLILCKKRLRQSTIN